MSAPQSVAVRVIYDSSQRRRRGSIAYVSRRSATKPLLVFGTLNLFAAAALYYAIWWRVDPYIYMTFMLRTPIITEDMQLPAGDQPGQTVSGEDMIASMFGINMDADKNARQNPISADPADAEPEPPPQSSVEMRWSNSTSQKVIPATAYGWLTLATAACCAVALAAGGAIGAGSGAATAARIAGLLILLFLIGGLTYGAYVGFTRYTSGYPVEYLRTGMGGFALLAAAIGLAISPQGRGLRRVTRLAAYSLVLSAIASAVGVYLWRQAGAIEPQYATAPMLALIFAAHSAWGWLLLIFSFRI